MKVFINNRNYLTWPKAMAEKLAREQHTVIFIDNASTYEPLLEFYATCPYRVEHLPENVGHLAPWKLFFDEMQDDYYAVTDPDLDLSSVPANWAEVMVKVLEISGNVYGLPHPIKIGLSLDDSRIPRTNPTWWEDKICDFPDGGHPEQWGPRIDHNSPVHLYNRATDTTFAVYEPKTPFTIGGIRIGRPYTARHLPFHVVPRLTGEERAYEILMNDEIRYYMQHASPCSITARRFREAGLL